MQADTGRRSRRGATSCSLPWTDLRECGLFYDEDEHGRYLHLVTDVLGSRVFFEVVQRIGGYDGYGVADAPVRMAAHRRLRTSAG